MKNYKGILKKRIAILLAISMVLAVPQVSFAEVEGNVEQQEAIQQEDQQEIIEENPVEENDEITNPETAENHAEEEEENDNQADSVSENNEKQELNDGSDDEDLLECDDEISESSFLDLSSDGNQAVSGFKVKINNTNTSEIASGSVATLSICAFGSYSNASISSIDYRIEDTDILKFSDVDSDVYTDGYGDGDDWEVELFALQPGTTTICATISYLEDYKFTVQKQIKVYEPLPQYTEASISIASPENASSIKLKATYTSEYITFDDECVHGFSLEISTDCDASSVPYRMDIKLNAPGIIDMSKVRIVRFPSDKSPISYNFDCDEGIISMQIDSLGKYAVFEYDGTLPWESNNGDGDDGDDGENSEFVIDVEDTTMVAGRDYYFGLNSGPVEDVYEVIWTASPSISFKSYEDKDTTNYIKELKTHTISNLTQQNRGHNGFFTATEACTDVTIKAAIYKNKGDAPIIRESRLLSFTDDSNDGGEEETDGDYVILPGLAEGNFYPSVRALDVCLNGWNYEDASWSEAKYFIDSNDRNPIIQASSGNSYSWKLNLTEEGWKLLYGSREPGQNTFTIGAWVSDGTPADGIEYVTGMTTGNPFAPDSEEDENVIREHLLNINQYRRTSDPEAHRYYFGMTIADIIDDNGKAIIKPLETQNEMFSYIWRYGNKNAHTFSDSDGIIEYWCATFENAGNNTTPIVVDNNDFIDERDITTNASSLDCITDVSYSAGEIIYYVDKTKMSTEDVLVTEIASPSVSSTIHELFVGTDSVNPEITSSGKVSLKLDIGTLKNSNEAEISEYYELHWYNPDSMEKLTIDVVFEGAGNTFESATISSIPFKRLTISDDLDDSKSGFGFSVVYKNGHLETAFISASVDFDSNCIDTTILVKGPEKDGQFPTEYRAFATDGKKGNIQESFILDIKNTLSDYNDICTASNGYAVLGYDQIPQCYEIDAGNNNTQRVYYQYKFDRAEIAAWTFIRWYYEDGDVIDEYLCTCQGDELSATEYDHYDGDVPVSTTDGVSLDINFFPQSGTWNYGEKAEYWQIEPVDKTSGQLVDGEVTFIIPYPNNEAKQAAPLASPYEILHYADTTHTTVDTIYGTPTDAGIEITTDDFSPFMIVWKGQKDVSGATIDLAVGASISNMLNNPDTGASLSNVIHEIIDEATNSNVNQGLESEWIINLNTENLSQVLKDALKSASWSNLYVSLNSTLIDMEFESTASTAPKTITYDVTPQLVVIGTDNNVLASNSVNVKTGGTVTFRIPIPSCVTMSYARVEHKHSGSNSTYYHVEIKTNSNGEKYIELTVDKFSDFVVSFTNEAPSQESYTRRSYSSSSSGKKSSVTYSSYWTSDTTGAWRVKRKSGQYVLNAWLCDSAVKANGINVWYLLGADGVMVTAGLIQDKTGNFYSLETEHNGYYGSLRYKTGYYNCNGQWIYLEFEQNHNGSFGAIKNADGIEKLKAIYGVTQVGIDNSNCEYTANF